MSRLKPSVEEVRRLFSYNPETGKILSADGSECCRVMKRAYFVVSFGSKQIFNASTIAWVLMTGEWPKHTIDHIDRDGFNNRWTNFRPANQGQQQANRSLFKNNKSGIRGVYRQKGRYVAQIRFDGKTRHLGTFPTPQDAGAAVQAARLARWGAFAS